MNQKSRKQLAFLIVLLVLLSVSVFSQFSNDRPASILSSEARSNSRRSAAMNEVLDVDSLSQEVPAFSGVKRNIFQFGAGTAESHAPVIPVPQVVEPKVVEAPSVPEVHYLGFYYEKESGLKMAALSNSGRIYVGKAGQILGGKYEVLEIADDHVILKVLYEEGKIIRVPLGKAPGAFVESKKEQEE